MIDRYVGALDGALQHEGFAGDVLIVQSNGGVMSAADARRFPIRTALSGPAAGVAAAAYIAANAGLPDVITCDMGGTSFDVSLVAGGQHTMVAQAAVDFGLVIRSPMVEIATIGAGGGSIATIDRAGLLGDRPGVGRRRPGPACYGLGNERPTVTDANVVLARINPDRPIGGKLERLDVDAAREAIRTHVAVPLGLDSSPPPRRSCGWRTRAWPARFDWSRSSAVTIRAASRCSPSAAAPRCTSARSCAKSARNARSSRRSRASPARWAA